MNSTSLKKPAIPKELYAKTNFELLLLSSGPLLCIMIGSTLAVLAYKHLFCSPNLLLVFASIPILMVMPILSGLGMISMAYLAHDGGHGSLHKNFKISFLLGVLGSSIVPGYFGGTAFNCGHFSHHKYTNTSKDSLIVAFSGAKVMNHWRPITLFLIGIGEFQSHFMTTLKCFLRIEKVPNLSADSSRNFAFINFIFNLSFTLCWLLLLKIDVATFILGFFVPWLWSIFIIGFSAFVEHGDTEGGFRNSWTFSNFFYRLLTSNENYHLEHHLYILVQRSKLHKVHKYLKSINFYTEHNCLVSDRFWKAISVPFTSEYPKPIDEDHDWMPSYNDKAS